MAEEIVASGESSYNSPSRWAELQIARLPHQIRQPGGNDDGGRWVRILLAQAHGSKRRF
jgi:hypothetical protein